ncbi:DciA family protein [Thioalkalicoccus limnaeus]|uniref:DciA family protein n=1 Tax=Thioalkalicoccus limnaeus TaxID=120681 RepID=A0ABV4BH41_9GAMM
MTMRQVFGFLQSNAAIEAGMDASRRDQAVLTKVLKVLPQPLRAHCQRVVIKPDKVVLYTNSAVWATPLRFLAPEIVRAVGTLKPDIQSCQVRVRPQADNERETHREPRRRRLSSHAAGHLIAAAQSMTDPGLAAAFHRLAASAEIQPPPTADRVLENEPRSPEGSQPTGTGGR